MDKGQELLESVKREVISKTIPSGWDIYKWCEEHPKTTIAAAVKRIERIMDFSDDVYFGTSAGKDSTLSANLAMLELILRKHRAAAGVDRDGKLRVDPLDAKWVGRRLSSMMEDAEITWSMSNDYVQRFLAKYGRQEKYVLDGVILAPGDRVELEDEYITAEEAYNRVIAGEQVTAIFR